MRVCVKRPFEPSPRPRRPLPARLTPRRRARPPLISAGQLPVGSHQDLHHGPSLTGVAVRQMGAVDRLQARGAPGRPVPRRRPRCPAAAANASSAPANGPAGAVTSAAGSTPARAGQPLGPAARQQPVAPGHAGAPDAQRRVADPVGTAARRARPGPADLEDPVLDPAVGADQRRPARRCPATVRAAPPGLSRHRTPPGPRSGSGW